ncbi:MAG TPA: isoleucine--tRNA ligase [Candidatus Thermoplasmatota archaeon]
MAVLQPPPEYDPQAVEREVADFWKAHRIFERSVSEREGAPLFSFIDGPPTANGLPGSHHVISRALKDLVPRYQTMRGFQVPRRAGWDTHGLPVEISVERELGITGKGDIEKLGVARFNQLCRESVWRYEAEWRKMSERMAYWVDMDDPFITLSPEYVESVWWALRQIYDKGLLFKGLRVAPYCPRCGTTLSSHEVSQGYDDIEDPSVFVRFPLRETRDGPPRAVLGWTTTPWTLPSNVALAVAPGLDYVEVDHKGERLVLLEGLVKTALKGAAKVVGRFKGADLVGAHYEPPFDFVPLPTDAKGAFRVYAADFVSHEEGTGVVHVAPAFGEDDADLARREGLPVLQPVDGAGRFREGEGGPVAGQFFKDADGPLLAMLKASGRLYRLGKHKHTYPFCWRCETPLMYFATDSWYIGMSRLRDEIKAVNGEVQWFPEAYKWGRYGDFLENLKDWALSRERYWGTPLPVWRCPQGHEFVPGSYAELRERTLGWPEPFDPHRPMIDELEVVCATCGTRMAREPFVIDTWFDSGSCFFGQFHYPHENREAFLRAFPADFIAEGIDQTRGWFYSMMAISTAIWGKPAYKRVLVNGLVLDKDGAKMSKSKGNVVDPWEIFNKEGADALRWYLFTQSPPWHDKRFDASFAREAVAKFLLPLWNSYAFLATYGAVDGFDPDTAPAPPARRPPLDRWLASRLSKTVGATTAALDTLEVHKAARAVEDFVVLDLSTWWIRRSRDRFWGEEETDDKQAAYASLHDALLTVCRLAAPFVPFVSDKLYRSLRPAAHPESVHLARWPEPSPVDVDDGLEAAMARLRALAEAGHRLRNEGSVKTRQPLREAFVVAPDAAYSALEPLLPLLMDELNVKAVRRAPSKDAFLNRSFHVPIKRLGPRFRGESKAVAEAVERLPPERVAAMVDAGKPVMFEYQNGRRSVELPAEYFEVESSPRAPFAVAEVEGLALVLNLELNEELRAEGFAREVIRCVQQTRKQSGLRVQDRILLWLEVDDASWRSLTPHLPWVARETQADAVERRSAGSSKRWEIDGAPLGVSLSRSTP